MITIKEYSSAAIDDRVAAFADYLKFHEGKKDSTVKGYVRYAIKEQMFLDKVKLIAKANVIFEVVDENLIYSIYSQILPDSRNIDMHGGPSACAKAYLRFIQTIRYGTTHKTPTHRTRHTTFSPVCAPSLNQPGSPEYIPACKFINSSIPDAREREILELIINFNLPLVSTKVCFADILPKISVEFSPEIKTRTSKVTARDLATQIPIIEKEIESLEKEVESIDKILNTRDYNENDPLRRKSRQILRSIDLLYTLKRVIQQYLKTPSTEVDVDFPVLGEFTPSPSPTVILYYNNIKWPRWAKMAQVFIHEMFHAWNYFRSGDVTRSVMVVDEPMVEFASLYFIKELAYHLSALGHPLQADCEYLLTESIDSIERKQHSVGDLPAYGFGAYIYKNVTHDAIEWIEIYSARSAQLDKHSNDIKDIHSKLIPVFPIGEEKKVLDLFRKVIFKKAPHSTGASSSGTLSALTHKDLLLECIKTLPSKTFDTNDIMKFGAIFSLVFPNINKSDLNTILQSALDVLTSEGSIECFSPSGIYKVA